MSLRFIINIGDDERNPAERLEMEFWPNRGQCQARAISRQGVVETDKQRPMTQVIAGLREAMGVIAPTTLDEKARGLIQRLADAVPLSYTDCHGDKCREALCVACFGMDEVKAKINDYTALINEADSYLDGAK